MHHFFSRFSRRLVSYSGVGISTYVLDIFLVSMLVYGFGVAHAPALVAGFGVGVTINYLLCYYWVYRGTRRNLYVGLSIFTFLATSGMLIILTVTPWLMMQFALPLLIARTIAAGCIGLINFCINTFFNFKLI
ncbi:MAG: GtrA family protein [Patescibacteria group bacterium]